MLGESDGTTGNATIEQIGRRRTFTTTLQLAIVLAVVQWPMRAAVHDAAGSAFDCEVPGRLSLLVDAMFIMAYVYAAFRAYKYVKFLNRQSLLNRQSWEGIAAFGSWLVFGAAVLDIVEDVWLWSEFGASTGPCADLSTGWFTWLMRAVGSGGSARPRGLLVRDESPRPAEAVRRPDRPTGDVQAAHGRRQGRRAARDHCSGGGIRLRVVLSRRVATPAGARPVRQGVDGDRGQRWRLHGRRVPRTPADLHRPVLTRLAGAGEAPPADPLPVVRRPRDVPRGVVGVVRSERQPVADRDHAACDRLGARLVPGRPEGDRAGDTEIRSTGGRTIPGSSSDCRRSCSRSAPRCS